MTSVKLQLCKLPKAQHTILSEYCTCASLGLVEIVQYLGQKVMFSFDSLTELCISYSGSMTLWLCGVLVLFCASDAAQAMLVTDMDYGGIPLWINRLLGEPSVLSLQGRMDPAWFRANNPQFCPEQCVCPIQWPTSLYCDNIALEHIPEGLPPRTQYLFLQVEKKLYFCGYFIFLF